MNLVPLSSRQLSSYFSRKFIDQWLLEISRLSFHAMYFFLQGNREAISRFFTERSIFPLETQYHYSEWSFENIEFAPRSFILHRKDEKIRRTVLNSATCILNSRKLCNEQLLDRRTEISNIYIYFFFPLFSSVSRVEWDQISKILSKHVRLNGIVKISLLGVYAREKGGSARVLVDPVLVIWPDYLPPEWRRVILKWFRFNFQDSTRRGRPDIR